MKEWEAQLAQNEEMIQKKQEEYLSQLAKEEEDWMSTLDDLQDGESKLKEVVTNLPKSPKFIGDYKWQREAITNIVKNAIEHSFENSKIYITAENSSVMLKLNIRDEGEGIDQEDRRHIFERFYKSKRSSEYSFGIGLSLAKSIIEKNNGYITVNSEIGKGTEFEIRYLK